MEQLSQLATLDAATFCWQIPRNLPISDQRLLFRRIPDGNKLGDLAKVSRLS
jgi:hypothetical protein